MSSATRSRRGTRPRGRPSSSARACSPARWTPTRSCACRCAMLNRHGLIAGATGTGKTVTLQMISEQLSRSRRAGVRRRHEGRPVGSRRPRRRRRRRRRSARPSSAWSTPRPRCPVEFLALGGIGPGVPVRATVSDFGPQLLAKVLGSNDTQEQSLSLVFRYADEKALPLLDLSDLRALLAYLESDQGKAELTGLGGVSKATIGVLLRALAMLEDGGGNELFGEPQFVITDLLRVDAGRPRDHLEPRAAGGAGQAGAVLDGAHVDARRAVRGAARGGRPREAQARVLLRRGPPAVRRRDQGVPRVGRPRRCG